MTFLGNSMLEAARLEIGSGTFRLVKHPQFFKNFELKKGLLSFLLLSSSLFSLTKAIENQPSCSYLNGQEHKQPSMRDTRQIILFFFFINMSPFSLFYRKLSDDLHTLRAPKRRNLHKSEHIRSGSFPTQRAPEVPTRPHCFWWWTSCLFRKEVCITHSHLSLSHNS